MSRLAAPPAGEGMAVPLVLLTPVKCVTCPARTRLLAQWRGPGEALCWWCWARGWDLVPAPS